MEYLDTIQNLYRPLQPSVRLNTAVTYEEIKPTPPLRPYIYCYWQLRSKEKLSQNYMYKVVADGCIDIFFEISDLQNSSVMGFCRNYMEFDLGHEFHYVGVRFLPTMFAQIFKYGTHQLKNKVANLSDIHPATAIYIENNIHQDIKLDTLTDRFNHHFDQLINIHDFNIDSRLYDAINIIYEKGGQVNLTKDINTGISPRQLRRLFQYYIGDTAKAFSKVVQFQNTLSSIRNLDQLSSDRIYLDNGYYDQAHFIKDFKNFYGVTPSLAFE